MRNQTKGRCRYCGKEYTRAGIVRHLHSCRKRQTEEDEKTGKECGYFELMITAPYCGEYWLVIEIKDSAELKDLDQFIRDIWVECCGHLSSFTIGDLVYDSEPYDRSGFGESKSMKISLNKMMEPGQQYIYEYDFGSTTTLYIKVTSHRIGKQQKEKITILSRNNPPEILCSTCQKNKAVWVNPEGFYTGTPYWCEECLKKMRTEDWSEEELEEYRDELFEDYMLPVCNSPRMGVCGYEGSEKYPNEM